MQLWELKGTETLNWKQMIDGAIIPGKTGLQQQLRNARNLPTNSLFESDMPHPQEVLNFC